MQPYDHEILARARLQLHIELPDLEECYVDGYESANHKLQETDNPFKEGSSEYQFWADGWYDGYHKAQPLFTLNKRLDHQKHLQTSEHEVEIVENPVIKLSNNSTDTQHTHKIWLTRTIQVAVALAAAVAAYQFLVEV
ncbi:MAG: transmission trait enhancer LetE [Gammaproteobacteria bacterium]